MIEQRFTQRKKPSDYTYLPAFVSNAKLNATRSALFATEAKSIMIARGSVATDD